MGISVDRIPGAIGEGGAISRVDCTSFGPSLLECAVRQVLYRVLYIHVNLVFTPTVCATSSVLWTKTHGVSGRL